MAFNIRQPSRLQPALSMDSALNQIASNNTAGAAEILRNAGEVFSQLRVRQLELDQGSVDEAQQAIRETGVALVMAQPDMSPLMRLASVAISAARTATSAQDAFKSAEDHALEFIDGAERAVHATALHAASLIREGVSVLTHSRSSTVLAAFIEAKRAGTVFSVIATESSPGLEGRTLALALVGEQIRTTLIADADASLAMSHVDLVLVGADTVTPNNLVNKIGTRMLAGAALERGVPFYAACDTSKLIQIECFGWRVRNEGRVDSLSPDAPEGVLAGNTYFEPTSLSHITGVITEDGILSSEKASLRAAGASIDKTLLDAIEELRQEIR